MHVCFKNFDYNLTGSCFRMSGVWRVTKPKTDDVQRPSKMKVTRYHQQANGQSVMWNRLLVPWLRLQIVRYEVLIYSARLPEGRWSESGPPRAGSGSSEKNYLLPPPPPLQARANQLKIFTLNRKDWLSFPFTGIWSGRVDLHNWQIMIMTKKDQTSAATLIRPLFAATPSSLLPVGMLFAQQCEWSAVT